MGGLIHVGAHTGTEYLDWDGPPLLLFEPQAEPFAELRANFRNRPGVRVSKVALGSAPGLAMLHLSPHSMHASLLEPKRHLELYPEITFDGEERVRVETLDGYMSRYHLSGFDELVMDVQGYELEVLRGAHHTLRGISEIVTEVNTQEIYVGCAQLEDLDDFLKPLGFERTQMSLDGPEGSCGDAVYIRARELVAHGGRDDIVWSHS